MNESLKDFINIYAENRQSKKQEYPAEEIIELDFEKVNGKYTGENSEKVNQYIYLMKSKGLSFSEISMSIDITISNAFRRYHKYLKELNNETIPTN